MRLAPVVFALAACGSVQAQNLIVDGGFESPVAPPGLYLLNVTPTGWTGLGDIVAQGYFGSVDSGDGAQWLDLNPGAGAGTGISQSFSATAGTYAFSFLYNGGQPMPGWTTSIAYTLKQGSTVLASGSVATGGMNVYAGTPWATLQDGFTVASTGTVTLSFMPNGVWANGFVDAVSVTASAVPEPASAWLALAGALVLGGRLRSRARAPQ